MKKIKGLSIFFPCYNDGGTIASMVLMAKNVAMEFTDDFEIIVIDDGSSDYSQDVLYELKKIVKELKVIRHSENKGYGGALMSGFENVSKDWVFYTDGDAQYDLRDLRKFLRSVESDIDVIQGYKIKRRDPLYRVILGKTYNLFVKILFGIHIKDVDCDFRLMRKRIAKSLNLESNSGAVCVEMVKKIELGGAKIKELPVNHYYRMYGISQFFRIKRVFELIFDLIHLKFKFIRLY